MTTSLVEPVEWTNRGVSVPSHALSIQLLCCCSFRLQTEKCDDVDIPENCARRRASGNINQENLYRAATRCLCTRPERKRLPCSVYMGSDFRARWNCLVEFLFFLKFFFSGNQPTEVNKNSLHRDRHRTYFRLTVDAKMNATSVKSSVNISFTVPLARSERDCTRLAKKEEYKYHMEN